MEDITGDAPAAHGDVEHVVHEACLRYWAAIDRRDSAMFLAAFTDDAVVEYNGGTYILRPAELVASGRIRTSGGYRYTCHIPGTCVMAVQGDDATADMLVVAVLVPHDGPISVRGLHYLTELRRTDGGWRINHLVHHSLWQLDADPVACALLPGALPPGAGRS